jgi:hypothetical protein
MIRKRSWSYYEVKGGRIHIKRDRDLDYACGVYSDMKDQYIKRSVSVDESRLCKNCIRSVRSHG